jgi:zinc transport system ATP-binding protein
MTILIQADNVSFISESRVILDRVSMQLHAGEILTVIGPNGAGKTTLLRILIGLMQPTTGKIHYPNKIRFGYMPQKLHLNTALPLPVSTFLNARKVDAQDLQNTLNELNIAHLYNNSMHQLSGGEKQRVLLARAMLRNPDVLVLDEPAQGVDISGQQRFYELIDKVRERHHCAVLMVSHDLHLVMAKTDRVICLNQHICCHGHPDDISNDQAYLSLFTDNVTPALAPYTHHHNHHHDLHGAVIVGEHDESCQHDH